MVESKQKEVTIEEVVHNTIAVYRERIDTMKNDLFGLILQLEQVVKAQDAEIKELRKKVAGKEKISK